MISLIVFNDDYTPFTLVGPPAQVLVLDPLAAYALRTVYICHRFHHTEIGLLIFEHVQEII